MAEDPNHSIPAPAARVEKKMEAVKRKGPTRADVSSAAFLPIDVRRGIFMAFHERGYSVHKLAIVNRLKHAAVEAVLRVGRDKEIGNARQMAMFVAKRAA